MLEQDEKKNVMSSILLSMHVTVITVKGISDCFCVGTGNLSSR